MITATFQLDLKPLEDLQRKLARQIVYKAIKKVAREAKDRMQPPTRYGYLKKSLWVKMKRYRGTVVAVIGPRSKYVVQLGTVTRGPHKGQARRAVPSFYAHLVEGGSKRSKATPFLKPALPTAGRIAEAIKQEMSLLT